MHRETGESGRVAQWELARGGDLRGGAEASYQALREAGVQREAAIDLHLVAAFCAMRQGLHDVACRELEEARQGAANSGIHAKWSLRVGAWSAELAYFQGRYSEAESSGRKIVDALVASGEYAYAAFALRTQIAILLARADYPAIASLADRAIELAEAGCDDYVIVQVFNILGAASFDRATSKLDAPHARAHLTALERCDTGPMEVDARDALRMFERAREVALRAGYEYAAWYVSGNIERLQIVLGNADQAIPSIRKRLRALQARGAAYDEIVTRSNLAWALRTVARHREALHELDVALAMTRATGTFNVLLEFLEYDRSIVLGALGDVVAARASHRRYLQLNGTGHITESHRRGPPPDGVSAGKRPLEPYYLKRADRFIAEHVGRAFTVAELSKHCGVSARLLEKAFADYRGITPVAHVRNVRLDAAFAALEAGDATVAGIARQNGFGSSTTFALEFRRRHGIAPSRVKRRGRDTKRVASM